MFKFCSDATFKYLRKWTDEMDHLKVFNWILLREVPTWKQIKSTALYLVHKEFCTSIDNALLLDQFGYLKEFLTTERFDEWTKEKTTTEQRWLSVFRNFERLLVPFKELGKIVEFALTLSGTSAVAERVFSSVNKIWTSEKTQYKVENLKAVLMVKHNFDMPCLSFFDFLKAKPELLEKIGGQEKYVN